MKPLSLSAATPATWRPAQQRALLPSRRAARVALRVCASSSSSGGSTGGDPLDSLRRWAKQQKLDEKLKDLQQNVESTAKRLDSEYDLQGKARSAAAAAQEQAAQFETRTGLGRKLRLLWSDLQRTWPARQRQLADFFNTPLGGITLFVGFVLLLSTGLFWRLLSWFFLLTWLAPLLLLPLIQRQQAAQAERVRQAYEEELRRQQRARSPFGSSMDDLFGNLRGQQQRQRGGRGGGRGGVGGDGPVIDVSWSTIDDDK